MSILTTTHPNSIHKLVELDNVGHCPNHEAPKAVAYALHRWLGGNDDGKYDDDDDDRFMNEDITFYEEWGDITMKEIYDYDDMGVLDEFLASFLIK